MNDIEKKKLVFDFLDSYHLCALSTISPQGKPETAIMAFSQTEDLHIFFQTPNYYRKYQNLKNNPDVAIAVGWNLEDMITVQFEGEAKEATVEEIDKIRQIHIGKNPTSKPYAYLPENKYFVVTPKWIRYMNLKVSPTQEFTLNY